MSAGVPSGPRATDLHRRTGPPGGAGTRPNDVRDGAAVHAAARR